MEPGKRCDRRLERRISNLRGDAPSIAAGQEHTVRAAQHLEFLWIAHFDTASHVQIRDVRQTQCPKNRALTIEVRDWLTQSDGCDNKLTVTDASRDLGEDYALTRFVLVPADDKPRSNGVARAALGVTRTGCALKCYMVRLEFLVEESRWRSCQ